VTIRQGGPVEQGTFRTLAHTSVDGNAVHTGQLFFDEAINDAVFARESYNAHTGQRMLNDQDGIYSNGGAASMLALTQVGDGYTGEITLGVRA